MSKVDVVKVITAGTFYFTSIIVTATMLHMATREEVKPPAKVYMIKDYLEAFANRA